MSDNKWMTHDLTMIVDVGSDGFPRNERERNTLKSLIDTLRSKGIVHVVVNRNGDRKMSSENVMTTFLNLPSGIGKAEGLNLALSRVRTDFVMMIDVSAKVDIQGIRLGMSVLYDSPELHYVFGAHDSSAISQGDIEVGSVLSRWGSPYLTFPVAPNALIARREALLSVSGYAAIPQCEAMMTALRLSNAYRGFQIDRRMLSGEVGLSAVHESMSPQHESWSMTALETCFEMSYAELKAGRMGSSYGRVGFVYEVKDEKVEEKSAEPVPAS